MWERGVPALISSMNMSVAIAMRNTITRLGYSHSHSALGNLSEVPALIGMLASLWHEFHVW